jgi:hypothetical protein
MELDAQTATKWTPHSETQRALLLTSFLQYLDAMIPRILDLHPGLSVAEVLRVDIHRNLTTLIKLCEFDVARGLSPDLRIDICPFAVLHKDLPEATRLFDSLFGRAEESLWPAPAVQPRDANSHCF